MSNSTGTRKQRDVQSRASEALIENDKELIQSLKLFSESSNSVAGLAGPSVNNSPKTPAGNYLAREGDSMIGPLALGPPLDFSIEVDTNNTIDIGPLNENFQYTSNVQLDDLQPDSAVLDIIANAAFDGQILVLRTFAPTVPYTISQGTLGNGGNIQTGDGNDITMGDLQSITFIFDEDLKIEANLGGSWRVIATTAGIAGGEFFGPWTANHDAGGFSLNNLLSLDIEDSAGATKLNISGPLGVGARFSFIAGDTVFFTENITDIISITAAGLNLLTNDIAMGVGGNIIAGGAGEGLTNTGHIDFIDNLATPGAAISLYSDGTDLFANTGGGVVNFSNLMSNPATVNLDMATFDIDEIDRLVFDKAAGSTLSAASAGITSSAAGDLHFNVVTAGEYALRINNVDEWQFSATIFDINGNSIDNVFTLTSAGTNPANGGTIRFANGEPGLGWRNFANTDNHNLEVNASDQFSFIFEGVSQFTISATAINLTGSDLTMGAGGNIIAGAAGEGMTNIGHLDFIDNLATPAAALSIYSDGTDILVNTGGGVVNISDVGDGIFLDSAFRIQGSADQTKQLAFEVDGFTTATTRTFTMPNVTGTVFLALAFQDLDMNASSIIGAGAGEGMSNIGNLTFVDNLATPGATFAIFSDGTDLFANTGSVTKNLDLMMSNPSVDNLDMSGNSIINAVIAVSQLSGIIGIANGGTSNSTYARGDMLYAPAAATLSRLPIGANGAFLMSDGTDLAWDTTPVMQDQLDMNGNDIILDADGDSRFDLGVDDEITIFLASAVTENYKFTTTSLELLAGNYLDASDAGTPALAGAVRFANNQVGLGWLNNAGTESILLTVNTSDELDFVFDSVVQATLSASEFDLTGSKLANIGGTTITDLTTVTGITGDFVMISDASDGGNIKKVNLSDLLGGSTSFIGFTADADLDMGVFDIDLNGNNIDNVLTLTSAATTPANGGTLRFGNNEPALGWRNAGNTDNILLEVNASDEFSFIFGVTSQFRISATDIDLTGSDLIEGGTLNLIEQAAANPDVAGRGQIWVRTATPNELFFTDDAGTDFQLGVAGGGDAVLANSQTWTGVNTYDNGGANGILMTDGTKIEFEATTATNLELKAADNLRDPGDMTIVNRSGFEIDINNSGSTDTEVVSMGDGASAPWLLCDADTARFNTVSTAGTKGHQLFLSRSDLPTDGDTISEIFAQTRIGASTWLKFAFIQMNIVDTDTTPANNEGEIKIGAVSNNSLNVGINIQGRPAVSGVRIGFYNTTPTNQQTLAASPTAAQISTVLKNLGLTVN